MLAEIAALDLNFQLMPPLGSRSEMVGIGVYRYTANFRNCQSGVDLKSSMNFVMSAAGIGLLTK
jgi:hypothetical protein